MIVQTWNVTTLAGLLTALREAAVLAEAEGRLADDVHVGIRSVFLVRQECTDGSDELDVLLFDDAPEV